MAKGANKLSWTQKPVMGETYRINECCCCLGSLKYWTILIGVIYTVTYKISLFSEQFTVEARIKLNTFASVNQLSN
jgi:hypothetical protein